MSTQPDGCRYVSATHNRRMYIRKYPLRLNNRNDQQGSPLHFEKIRLCLIVLHRERSDHSVVIGWEGGGVRDLTQLKL